MKQELLSEILKRYPKLFVPEFTTIECDDGWFNLINILCLELYSDYNSAKSLYDICLSNSGSSMYPWIESSPIVNSEMILESHNEVCKRLDTLPKIVQIKEKYGSLRIYAKNITEEQRAKIEFATLISTHICEECGSSAPNEVQCSATGYRKTLCNSCMKRKIDLT